MSDIAGPFQPPATPAPRHWQGTESSHVVNTAKLKEVRADMASLHDGGAMVVTGPPGLGKTFAVDLAFQGLDIDKYWIAMPHEPKGKETTSRILQALTGKRTPRSIPEYTMLEDIAELLEDRHVALAIDEAQHLTTASFRQFMYLLDHQTTNLLLVLCGVRVDERVMARCPELDSRIERRVHFADYRRADMVKIARHYHPAFANADADALAVLSKFGGGKFRNSGCRKTRWGGCAAGFSGRLSASGRVRVWVAILRRSRRCVVTAVRVRR